MADVLSSIPGLGAFLAMQDRGQRKAMGDLQGVQGLMSVLRQQEEAQRAAEMAPLQKMLMQAQVGQAQQRAEQEARASAFYSPENTQKFMTPGLSAIEAPSEELGGGPGRPQTLPRLDLERFVNAGAAAGVIRPETVLNMQSQKEARMAAVEQRAAQAEQAHEARMAAARTAAERQAEVARHNRFMESIQAQMMAMRADRSQSAPASSGGRPPMGYRYKPDGDLEPIPGGPADVKATREAELKAQGSTEVDSVIAQLRTAYDALEKGGGITSKERGPVANLAASASASPVGQAVGRAIGTRNQSARNEIAMTRPALLAAIMKATGMSSRQLDSNAELKLWLTTATDPTLDVEANRTALRNIEERFLSRKPSTPAPTTDGVPAGVPADLWKAMTPEERKLWQK